MTPRARILSTGTEITQGMYADTNAMELSRRLTAAGLRVVGHEAVPDETSRIEEAIRRTRGNCELLVITGGIGPTEDDLNREILARLWESPLRRVHRAESMLRSRFAMRKTPMPENNIKQADMPVGAIALLNFWGTALAFALPPRDGWPAIVVLPGVPHEWRAMMDRYLVGHILPLLPARPATLLHVMHLALIPESHVNALIKPLFTADPRVEVTILASRGHIRLRFLARAANESECATALEPLLAQARKALPADRLFCDGPENGSFEGAVIEAFTTRGKTLALAESCTGGGVAHRLTDIAGSSAVLREGWVTYSNDAKIARLGVKPETLAVHGAVSEECVLEMAAGALAAAGADVALAISGIAGPGGGTPEKPVGTVWFGLAANGGLRFARHRLIAGDRPLVRHLAELQALDLLRRWVLGLDLKAG